MNIPARGPSTPARQVPSVLSTVPSAFSVAVFSPRYQTLPALSWAYQSFVRSASRPRWYTRSSMTVARMPSIGFVRRVTRNTSVAGVPSSLPLYVRTVPGSSGNHGLSTVRTNWLAGGSAGGRSLAATVDRWSAVAVAQPATATAAGGSRAVGVRMTVSFAAVDAQHDGPPSMTWP